jgi:hypothetical protein
MSSKGAPKERPPHSQNQNDEQHNHFTSLYPQRLMPEREFSRQARE